MGVTLSTHGECYAMKTEGTMANPRGGWGVVIINFRGEITTVTH